MSNATIPAASFAACTESEKCRVLIVEDDTVQASLVSRHLRSLPAEVTVVSTLGDAVQKVQSADFDCVIADLSLPDSWPAASAEWYTDLARQQMPVVVVSGCRGEIRNLRQRCPWLPFVLAKEDLDGPSLLLFVAAALRRGAINSSDATERVSPVN